MDGNLPYLLRFGGVFLLVFLNGLFVASEFAIVRAHPTKLKTPELERSRGTRSSLLLIEHLDRSLSATQLGITIASLILGWLGEEIFAEFFTLIFHGIDSTLEIALIHGISTTLALIVVTALHVVLGDSVSGNNSSGRRADTSIFLKPISSRDIYPQRSCEPFSLVLWN
jgi:CBS domain containing-hemolysin-like protein